VAILLLHGLGGDRRQPLALLGPALPDDATVLAPDIRAHGASPLLGEASDFTLDALAAEIAEGLPDEPLTIMGISLGAAVGLRLALRDDVDVEKLVFVRPAFTDEPLPENLAVFPVIGDLLQTYGAEHGEELFRDTEWYHDLLIASPLGAEGAIEQFRKPDAAERAIRLLEIPRHPAFASAAELARLTAPASIVAAPRDLVHPVDVAELWLEALPNASLTLVPARDESEEIYAVAIRGAAHRALAIDGPA
jgi:pimeloyl-ACP methyl ester carboxylesterase